LISLLFTVLSCTKSDEDSFKYSLGKNVIKKMEKGKHNFRVTELEKLSFGLETSVKYFFAVL
jgi:hypothetical protein